MRVTRLASVVLAGAMLLADGPSAPLQAQTTVDQMSCGAAIASAARAHRYYKRTGFGVVPIMPVFPFDGRNACLITEYQSRQVERTRDGAQCVIGYKCQERQEFWPFDR